MTKKRRKTVARPSAGPGPAVSAHGAKPSRLKPLLTFVGGIAAMLLLNVATDFYSRMVKPRLFPNKSQLRVEGYIHRRQDIPDDSLYDPELLHTNRYPDKAHLHFDVVNRGQATAIRSVGLIYYDSRENFESEGGSGGNRLFISVYAYGRQDDPYLVPQMPSVIEPGKLYAFDYWFDDSSNKRMTNVVCYRLRVDDALSDVPIKIEIDDPWKHLTVAKTRGHKHPDKPPLLVVEPKK